MYNLVLHPSSYHVNSPAWIIAGVSLWQHEDIRLLTLWQAITYQASGCQVEYPVLALI